MVAAAFTVAELFILCGTGERTARRDNCHEEMMIEGVKEEETIREKEYSVDSAVSGPFVVVEVVAGKQVTCCFVLSSAKTFLFAHLHTHTHTLCCICLLA